MHYAKEARSKVTFYWRVHVHLQETVKVDISECSVPSIDARTLNLIAVHSRQWSSSNLRYAHIVLALMAGRRIVSLDLTASNRRYACLLSSCQVRGSTYHDHTMIDMASEMHFNALRSLAQTCLTACCFTMPP